MTHIMNELIDEACGRVLQRVGERGWHDDTDVIFTTDHGELQGDYGLLFKGPFHVDALMRLPMVWRPAPSAGVAPAVVAEPVGQLDLAPTFCAIAGVPAPDWAEGRPLPDAAGSGRERVLCEWDSQFPGYGMHLRSIYRDGWLCTAYEPSTVGEPNGLEKFFAATGMFGGGIGPVSPVAYDGTEGELYDVEDDPHQFVNRWDDPDYTALRKDLVADLYDSLPAERRVLEGRRGIPASTRSEVRGLIRDRAQVHLLVPESRRTGRVAVADVPRLDLLEHPAGRGRRDEADADLQRQHHRRACSCGPSARPTAGPSTSPWTASRSGSSEPSSRRGSFFSRTHDANRPRPGSSSGLIGRHSVCCGTGSRPNGFGRSLRSGGVICAGSGTSGTANVLERELRVVRDARRRRGPAAPGLRAGHVHDRRRPAMRVRPSRSTSTSIVDRTGRHRREEDRVGGHERELGPSERLLHRPQRGVHADAAEHVHRPASRRGSRSESDPVPTHPA